MAKEKPTIPQRVDRKIQKRWTPKLAKPGFTPIVNVFLKGYVRLGLNSSEAMLITHLMSFKWDQNNPYPRMRLLAERMGMTARSVRSIIKKLEDKKLLTRKQLPNERANRYELFDLFRALERQMDENPSSEASAA